MPGAERTESVRVVVTVGSLDAADGGPSRTVPALCAEVAALGAVVGIVTCAGPGMSEEVQSAGTVPVSLAHYRSRAHRALRSAPFRRAVTNSVAALQARLIHDNGVWLQTNHGATAAARSLGLPMIISPRGMLEPWSIAHNAWRKRAAWQLFQRRDIERATLLHATSAMEADNLRALGLRQPIAVIPNGVELPAATVRHTPGAVRTAVFLSRLHPKKGLLHLVEAWAGVRPPGWRLVIAGPDADGHRAVVESAIASAGLASDVTLVGAVDGSAKQALLGSADLFVLPTHSENFGVVVAEALAHGVPVITTRGTPWALLESERCGWWTEIGAAPLATALREAVALRDDERRAMGARGHACVRERFAWAGIARDMHAVYAWVLGDGPQPSVVRHD